MPFWHLKWRSWRKNDHHSDGFETPWARIWPNLLILLPTSVSIVLLSLQSKSFTGHIVDLIIQNRTAVAVIVQLLALCLGRLQISSITTLINFAGRLRISQQPVTINSLSTWSALSLPRIDSDASYRSWRFYLTALMAFLAPGALWAAALTPLATEVWDNTGSIAVPDWTKPIWEQVFWSNFNQNPFPNAIDSAVSPETGVYISAAPVLDLAGDLLTTARTATTRDGSPRLHSKFDNAQWTYVGRSYGVGASVGLLPPVRSNNNTESQLSPVTYEYSEQGYRTDVSCIHNASSAWKVFTTQLTTSYTRVVFIANGSLPISDPNNGTRSYNLTGASYGESDFGAVVWSSISNTKGNMLAIASTPTLLGLNMLNRIQCNITFLPTVFSIQANLTQNTITVSTSTNVTSQNTTANATQLFPIIMNSLDLLSRISTVIAQPALGTALWRNAADTYEKNVTINTNSTTDLGTLLSVQDSIAAMVDDLLVAQGAYQMLASFPEVDNGQRVNGTGRGYVPARMQFQAIRFGSFGFIIATLAINGLVILAIFVEAVRTRFWNGLPVFNFVHTKALIAATCANTLVAKEEESFGYARVKLDLADGQRLVSSF